MNLILILIFFIFNKMQSPNTSRKFNKSEIRTLKTLKFLKCKNNFNPLLNSDGVYSFTRSTYEQDLDTFVFAKACKILNIRTKDQLLSYLALYQNELFTTTNNFHTLAQNFRDYKSDCVGKLSKTKLKGTINKLERLYTSSFQRELLCLSVIAKCGIVTNKMSLAKPKETDKTDTKEKTDKTFVEIQINDHQAEIYPINYDIKFYDIQMGFVDFHKRILLLDDINIANLYGRIQNQTIINTDSHGRFKINLDGFSVLYNCHIIKKSLKIWYPQNNNLMNLYYIDKSKQPLKFRNISRNFVVSASKPNFAKTSEQGYKTYNDILRRVRKGLRTVYNIPKHKKAQNCCGVKPFGF